MPAFTPVISAVASSPNPTRSFMALQKSTPPRFGPRGSELQWKTAWQTPRRALGRLLVLLVVVDFGEFRVDDVVGFAGAVTAGSGVTGTARCCCTFLRLFVHGLAELHRGLRQRVGLGRDRRSVTALEGFLEIGDRVLDRA